MAPKTEPIHIGELEIFGLDLAVGRDESMTPSGTNENNKIVAKTEAADKFRKARTAKTMTRARYVSANARSCVQEILDARTVSLISDISGSVTNPD